MIMTTVVNDVRYDDASDRSDDDGDNDDDVFVPFLNRFVSPLMGSILSKA